MMNKPIKNQDVNFLDKLSPLEKVDRYNAWMHSIYKKYIGRRVLEIGSGTGNLTYFYAKQVEYALCIDIDPNVIAYHQKRFNDTKTIETMNLNLLTTDLTKLKEKNFDTIICLNVLEHIKDDLDMLIRMKEVIQEGGNIILLVPALSSLYSFLDENCGHYRRYNCGDLKKLSDCARLQVVMQRYFNFFGVPIVYFQGKSKKRQKKEETFSGLLNESSSKLINMASIILKPIEKLIPPPVGVSEIIILTKTR